MRRQHSADELAFRRARLQLTVWYVLTLAVIGVLFSVVLYAALASQLSERERGGENRVPERRAEQETGDFALDRLRLLLLAGNLVILAGGTAGGYVLAGKTLHPIAVALERQRRFTADASHELRTPLTVMRGMVDVTLQRQRTSIRYEEVLGELGEEVDAMTDLVDGLLRLARDGSRPHAVTVRCDVQDILNEIVQGTAALADSNGDTVHLAPAEGLFALANTAEVRRVFHNLVTNALQHTPAGTKISLVGRCHDGVVEVIVSDNGHGIPREQRESVFEPFHRVEPASPNGAGLGLAICRDLVRANGGSITLNETAGTGATVRVRLPRAP